MNLLRGLLPHAADKERWELEKEANAQRSMQREQGVRQADSSLGEQGDQSGFPRSLQQFAQTTRSLIAVEFTRGHLENELFPLVRRQFRVRQQFVALQKDQACRQRSSFVSVDKGLVAAKIKQIGCGDLDRIRHQRLAHHRRLGRSHGGLQQCVIANAAGSAVRRQDFRVNRLDRRNCQVMNCFSQDKRLKSAEFFLISCLAAAAAFFGSMVGRSGVKTIEPPSCTVTVT